MGALIEQRLSKTRIKTLELAVCEVSYSKPAFTGSSPGRAHSSHGFEQELQGLSVIGGFNKYWNFLTLIPKTFGPILSFQNFY